MIVTFADGTKREMSILNCTGYVADRIELQPADTKALLGYLQELRILELSAIIAQLHYRFASVRQALMPPAPKAEHVFGCPAHDGKGACRCVELGGYI